MQSRRELFYSTICGDVPEELPRSVRPMRIQTRDGVELFHRDWGSGRPIVFVHSLSMSTAMWGYQEAFLSDRGYRCVSFDRRGHGRSGASAPGADLNTFADDLRDVIDGVDLHDVVLVGHSVGCGEIIRYLARCGSRRVAKVILLAPATPFVSLTADNPYGAPAAYFEQMQAQWAADFPKWVHENKLPFFTADSAAPMCSAPMMDWLESELLKAHVPTAIAYQRAYVATDLRPDLARIDRPVLVLHGDRDVSAPLEITGRRTALGIPGATLKVYPGAAHGLFVTHKDQVNRDMLEFIIS
jgi:non-heme chloroperoxidase